MSIDLLSLKCTDIRIDYVRGRDQACPAIINGKECESLRDFLGHDDSRPGDEPAPEVERMLDELVVLKIVQVGDTTAIILSSRRLLLNIRQSLLGQL